MTQTTEIALIFGSLVGVVGAWLLLISVRSRLRRRIDGSAASPEKKLELQLQLDTELLKLGAGAVVVIGLALTAVQALDAHRKAMEDIVTTREEKAYVLLGNPDDGSHVGGVHMMSSLDEVDPRGREDRFRSLMIFARRWSPYSSERTQRCQVPNATLMPKWADDLPRQPSKTVDVGTQAVLQAFSRVGGVAALGRLDFATTNLSQASLDGLDLHGAMLAYADLSGASLRGADLRKADLFCTNMFRAHLHGIHAAGANIPGALLTEADAGPEGGERAAEFVGATLNGADLRGAKLCDVDFANARLEKAALDGAILYRAKFKGADLTETSLQEAKLGGVSFEGVVMRTDALKPNLTCADLDAGQISAEAYCHASDGVSHVVPAATLPDDLRARFTLCRTRIGGMDDNRDCPSPPPSCARDALPPPA